MIYISHLLPDEEMQELIEETGAGVESIEFSISDNLDQLSEHIHTYRKRLKQMEAEHLIIHGPFLDLAPYSFDSEILKTTEKRYEQAYQAAVELGAEKIVYHTCYYPGVYFPDIWAERTIEFYQKFLEKHCETEIVLENVMDTDWNPIKRVADAISAPQFGLCLDIGHAHCSGEELVTEWVRNLNPYCSHLHVHDNHKKRDEHLALGQGTMPLQQLFMLLSQTPADTCTIECMDKEQVRQCWQVLRESGWDAAKY